MLFVSISFALATQRKRGFQLNMGLLLLLLRLNDILTNIEKKVIKTLDKIYPRAYMRYKHAFIRVSL